jgi:hypothetical protein
MNEQNPSTAPAGPPRHIPADPSDERHGGAAEVVSAELAYVRRRPGRPRGQELTGLAISGGGIRSASFGLGVIQALAEKDALRRLDYLSTVSGGGYIGASLTWLLHRTWGAPREWPGAPPRGCREGEGLRFSTEPKCFPYTSPAGEHAAGTLGPVRTALLRHLRQNGKYLTPGQGTTAASLAAVVLRGSAVSVLVYLPLLVLLMLVVMAYVQAAGWPMIAAVTGATLALAGGVLLAAWFRGSVWLSLERTMRWRRFARGLWSEVLVPALVVTGIGLASLLVMEVLHVQDFEDLFGFAGALAVLGVVCAVLYAAGTFMARTGVEIWYRVRRGFEVYMGLLLMGILAVLLLGSLPLVDGWIDRLLQQTAMAAQGTGVAGGMLAALGGLLGGGAYRETLRVKVRPLPLAIQVWLGAGLLVYGLLLLAYALATPVCDALPGLCAQPQGQVWQWRGGYLAWLVLALAVGRFTNVNFLSVHRYYRDRLMETFMPSPARVLEEGERDAREADGGWLADMCRWERDGQKAHLSGPYHLVNTNVILVDSKVRKLKARGGDSFLLSPLYCGSNATGWLPTKGFMGGHMTLATAMAISGAAASPNAGVGGEGPTRNPLLSFLMSLLNIRLGYWAQNPAIPGRETAPDLLQPGLGELLRYALDETGRYVQLSDGGHFENLAVYELVRRRVKVIICSDAGADPDTTFSDLGNLVEKVRVDFGATLVLDSLEDLVPNPLGDDPKAPRTARKGFVTGTVRYPDGEEATLVYIKSTWLPGLSADLVSYRNAHPSFPDQSTADQFFDERQFEAYRELGYRIGAQVLDALGDTLWAESSS